MNYPLRSPKHAFGTCIDSETVALADKCYPKKLSKNEMYWYLTPQGWMPWQLMDFSRMQVGVNIYMVVHSYFTPFLDPGSFFGSTRPVWTADNSENEFVLAAEKLIVQYGPMPNDPAIFHKHCLVEHDS